MPTRADAERLLRSTEIGVSAWMERMGLEIYPPFFLDEATEAREYPSPASDSGPPGQP